MNSRRFHQAWDEEIASWKMKKFRLEDAGSSSRRLAISLWHSENFAMIAKFSQS